MPDPVSGGPAPREQQEALRRLTEESQHLGFYDPQPVQDVISAIANEWAAMMLESSDGKTFPGDWCVRLGRVAYARAVASPPGGPAPREQQFEWEREVSRLAHAAYDEIERATISPDRKRHAHDGIQAFRRLLVASRAVASPSRGTPSEAGPFRDLPALLEAAANELEQSARERVISTIEERAARELADELRAAALAALPPMCPKCNDTGEFKSEVDGLPLTCSCRVRAAASDAAALREMAATARLGRAASGVGPSEREGYSLADAVRNLPIPRFADPLLAETYDSALSAAAEAVRRTALAPPEDQK